MPNIEKFREVREQIRRHRAAFEMADWVNFVGRKDPTVKLNDLPEEGACGTTACLAGWGALVDGYVLTSEGNALDPKTLQIVAEGTYTLDNTRTGATDFVLLGAQIFDLPYNIADDLFDLGSNDHALRVVDKLIEGGEWLVELYTWHDDDEYGRAQVNHGRLEDARRELAEYEAAKRYKNALVDAFELTPGGE